MTEPGPLLARGRHADVFALDEERVLRRYRDGEDVQPEASIMDYLTRQGYPVPHIYGTEDDALVMERLHGPTMLEDIARRPWRLGRHAHTLARLHGQLHAIQGPSWLPRHFGDSDTMLHYDLHPANVIITQRGAVVIDWQKAARGDPVIDIAKTVVILRTASVPGGIKSRVVGGAAREVFLRRFLAACADRPTASHLAQVARARLEVANLLPHEVERLQRLLRA